MNRYKLNPGEIVKIGRITMRIRDIKFNNQLIKNSLNESISKNKNVENNNKNKNKKENNITRLETSERKINENKNGIKKNL